MTTKTPFHKSTGSVKSSRRTLTSTITALLTLSTIAGCAPSALQPEDVASISAKQVYTPPLRRPTIRRLSRGPEWGLALTNDGKVRGWGADKHCVLGSDGFNYGQYPSFGSPTLLSSGIHQLNALPDVKYVGVAAGEWFGLALTEGGEVKAWGLAKNGQLGDGGTASPNFAASSTHPYRIRCKTFEYYSEGPYMPQGSTDYAQSPSVKTESGILTNVIDIAAGRTHALAVRSDGTVWAWGTNGSHELGDGTLTYRSVAKPVPGLRNIVSVAAGEESSYALSADGKVYVWGRNDHGQAGSGQTTYGAGINEPAVPQLVPGLSNIVSIVSRQTSVMALQDDGTLWAWGENSNRQLGIGTSSTNQTTPVVVSGLSGVVDMEVGSYASLLVNESGSVYAAGTNSEHVLMSGAASPPVQYLTPTLLFGAGTFGVPSVERPALGLYGESAMVLKSDGTGKCWGWFNWSNCAEGSMGNSTAAPLNTSMGAPLFPGKALIADRLSVPMPADADYGTPSVVTDAETGQSVRKYNSLTGMSRVGLTDGFFQVGKTYRVTYAVKRVGSALVSAQWESNMTFQSGAGDTNSLSHTVPLLGQNVWAQISHVATITGTGNDTPKPDMFITGPTNFSADYYIKNLRIEEVPSTTQAGTAVTYSTNPASVGSVVMSDPTTLVMPAALYTFPAPDASISTDVDAGRTVRALQSGTSCYWADQQLDLSGDVCNGFSRNDLPAEKMFNGKKYRLSFSAKRLTDRPAGATYDFAFDVTDPAATGSNVRSLLSSPGNVSVDKDRWARVSMVASITGSGTNPTQRFFTLINKYANQRTLFADMKIEEVPASTADGLSVTYP